MQGRRFWWWLAALGLIGLLVRIGAHFAYAADRGIMGDALAYHLLGEQMARGNGMVMVSRPDLEVLVEGAPATAVHPPLFPALLGTLHLLGITTVPAQKFVMALLGAATPVLIGIAGRQMVGAAVGLTAAAIAAVYPLLWVADGGLMSETPYGVMIALLLVVAFWARDRPGWQRFAVAGVTMGLAAMVRGEALVLGALMLTALSIAVGTDWRRRLAYLVAAAAGCMIALTPWTIRNLATFDEPVLISTNANAVFAGANCDITYYGDWIGLWSFDCYGTVGDGDESVQAIQHRDAGFAYAREHLDRVPVVLAARFGRLWSFYDVADQAKYDSFEGRQLGVTQLGLVMYYPLVALGIAGGVILVRRDRIAAIPPLSLIIGTTLIGLAVYGSTRFRFAAEPALVLLAAVAVVDIGRRLHHRTGSHRGAIDDPAVSSHP